LSSIDASQPAQSSGELRNISFRTVEGKTQSIVSTNDTSFNEPTPVIAFSEAFANKAQEAGIPISRTPSGQAYVDSGAILPTTEQPTANRLNTQITGGTVAGAGIGTLLLLGLGILALRK